LGFCNFYRQLISRFTKVAKPLMELTEKKEWKWKDKEKNTFNKLKGKMVNPPILVIPNPKQKLQLETNASGYAIGSILSQQQENSSWRSIAYLPRAMNKIERNYEIYDQELLAIMEGLKQWQQYLIGSDQFKI